MEKIYIITHDDDMFERLFIDRKGYCTEQEAVEFLYSKGYTKENKSYNGMILQNIYADDTGTVYTKSDDPYVYYRILMIEL